MHRAQLDDPAIDIRGHPELREQHAWVAAEIAPLVGVHERRRRDVRPRGQGVQLSDLPVVQSPVNRAAMVAYTGESLQVLR
jgi:hypothetical protein